MVLLNEIMTLVKGILAIKQQRQNNNDAYELLRTTLDVNIANLQIMDSIFEDDEDTITTRNKLHDIVTQIHEAIRKYEDLTIEINLLDYSRNFVKLNNLFQTCMSSLVQYSVFKRHERHIIRIHLDPSASSDHEHQINMVEMRTDNKSESLPPEIVNAILNIQKNNYKIQQLEM